MAIWAVCKDPSGVNTIRPIINELRQMGKEVTLIANGKAPELLIGSESFVVCNQVEAIHLPWPEAMVTSMCSQGGVGRDLVPLLRERGIPSISVQDFWGACVGKGVDGSWSDPIYRPSAICVGDEYAAKLVYAAWPDMPVERVRITGFPAMDKYATFHTSAMVSTVRQRFDLGNLKIVLFLGECLPGTSDMLNEVVAVLGGLSNVCLLPRQHPRMHDQAPDEIGLWSRAVANFPSSAGRLITDSSACELSSLVAAADVVLSAPLSSTPVDAAFLRRNSIMLFYPLAEQQFKASLGDQMDQVPVVALGCSRQVTNRAELKAALTQALEKGLGLTANQEKHFRCDGRNARRVADVVLSCLS